MSIIPTIAVICSFSSNKSFFNSPSKSILKEKQLYFEETIVKRNYLAGCALIRFKKDRTDRWGKDNLQSKSLYGVILNWQTPLFHSLHQCYLIISVTNVDSVLFVVLHTKQKVMENMSFGIKILGNLWS